jgi:hypothetical protein
MHPSFLLFILLFIPGSSLKDWQNAPSPVLHQLMSHGAIGLMNAKTAERDKITSDAGERSIFAGARLNADDRTDNLGYPAESNNLLNGLSNAGIGVSGPGRMPEINLPIFLPQPTKHFVSVDLKGTWPQIDQQLSVYSQLALANHGILMVVSPNPSPADYSALNQLTPALLWGPGVPSGYLVSDTTRTTGLITNTDIAPTIASLMGASLPQLPDGSQIYVSRLRSVNKIDVLLNHNNSWVAQALAIQFLPYIAAATSLLVLFVLMFTNTKLPTAASLVAVSTMIPVTLLLSSSAPVFAIVFLIAIIIALRALMPDDASPFTALTVIIYVTIDAFGFGGRLSGGSMLGYSPIEGARYYGIGNEVMGAYIGALAVLTGLWDWKGEHRTPLIILWIVAALALGLPASGAKAGGLIVCAITLAAYVSMVQGWKLTDIKSIAAMISAIAASIIVLLVFSHFGPKTQVSDSVALAKANGFSTIWQTIARKAGMDGYLVIHSVWIWVLALTSISRWQLHQDGILSKVGTVAVVACLLFNDAGVVAAAICSLTIWAAEFNRNNNAASIAARSKPALRLV